MSDPLSDLLQSLPPEQLAQILGAGTLDQNDQMLQQQQAQAHALRQQRMGQQPYGAGAGIASGIGSALEGIHQHQIEGRQQASLDKRQSSIDALVAALRQQKQAPGTTNAIQTPADGSYGGNF